MEQRPLRLGDTLDDYCPRERRLTNHAVVAIVEDTVKQTRCTTCDAEHPYKGGQAPRRRKKGAPALVESNLPPAPIIVDTDDMVETPADEVHASDNGASAPVLVEASAPVARDEDSHDQEIDAEDIAVEADAVPVEHALDSVEEPIIDDLDDDGERMPDFEEGPVHRPLIRATLPRPEGQKDERRPTDFTIRQNGGRGGNVAAPSFRGGNNGRMKPRGSGGGFSSNGHRPSGGPRFAGARPGQGQGPGRGQGGGFRSAQQQPRQGGGRKRSR
jgi:hypothetical protein